MCVYLKCILDMACACPCTDLRSPLVTCEHFLQWPHVVVCCSQCSETLQEMQQAPQPWFPSCPGADLWPCSGSAAPCGQLIITAHCFTELAGEQCLVDAGICHLQLMDFWEPQGLCGKARCCEGPSSTFPVAVVFLQRSCCLVQCYLWPC